jgi:hypothetical protein
MPISSDLFTKALALLAFVVAFYALAARERKTPYITNSIYATALWIFLSLLFQLIAQFIETNYPQASIILQYVARAFLIIGALNIAYGIWRIYNRHVNFRDDIKVKNLAIIRRIRRRLLSNREKPNYNFDAPKLPPDLKDAITECTGSMDNQFASVAMRVNDDVSRSIVYHGASLNESDNFITCLAQKLLAKGWAVQYTTCIRHPVEFINKLRGSLEQASDPRDLYKQIVVVDAYTPHFGFTDSILFEMTASLKRLGIHCVTSAPSYAGIHTATAEAFNKLKKQQSSQRESRRPTFIIYEGAFALVDLESIEQYRIFLRHVLPSERMWGGMLTCFVEPVVNEDSLAVLTTYADVLLEKKKDAILSESQTTSTAPGVGL